MPGLSKAEVERFHRDGFLGPFAACSSAEMDELRPRIETEVLAQPGMRPEAPGQVRHLDSRLVYDLCTRSEILDRIESLFGPDLVLWRSNFFVKQPGAAEIPWHQDGNYWPLEPVLNISAWVAIDHATVENSCLQLIPGSHRTIVPHIRAAEGVDVDFQEMADPAYIDASQTVDMELEPGEFVLFTERTLHHSDPNRSDRRRLGLAIRVTVPFVKIFHDEIYPDHMAMLIRGRDSFGLNRLAEPPPPQRGSKQYRASVPEKLAVETD
jgi:hypothetical protein